MQDGKKVWHTQTAEEIFKRMDTSFHGLSEEEAQKRLKKYGPNQLPEKKKASVWMIFLSQFKNPLIYVLLAAAIVSLVLQQYSDAGFIAAVLLLNATIGTIQEWKAEKSAASLQSLLKIKATVKRNGKSESIDAAQLVPGDSILLESGSHVPADVRLIKVTDLTIDESFLTGESIPVDKTTDTLENETDLGDRTNMAFAGATVLSGRGTGIVVQTGTHTQVGHIAKTVSAAEANKPPLVIRIEKLARQIAVIVLVATVVLGIVAFYQGMPLSEVFFLAVAMAVAAIPEGLPVTITVALSIATKRMAERNVIVRKLTAVEGLGSCTFIASDKTGTLTVNKQTVKKIIFPDDHQYEVSGEGYNGHGEILRPGRRLIEEEDKKRLQELSIHAVLCNEARLEETPEGWKQHGDAVDVALLAMAHKSGVEPEALRNQTEIVKEIPYESEKKYAASFYRKDGKTLLAIKGAVETLLQMASHMQTAEEKIAADLKKISGQASQLSQQGYRVLAIATAETDDDLPSEKIKEEHLKNLNLLGLVGLIDPLRPEVKESIQSCRNAGVEVAIVTGDHPETALAIASELNLTHEMHEVITGKELYEAGDPEGEVFMKKIQGKKVFARVTPLQKMHLVNALIRSGNYVAVTGDGVNDVPALKQANIGVAMGSGTDLAKDTAEIIVTDDNFSSIEAGIRGGRYAYDNIRKVTYLLISTGASELVIFVFALFAHLPLPLTAVQLLWLNLVTNGIQDVALAFEGGEPQSMEKPPRKPSEGIFNSLMIQESLLSGAVIGLTAFGFWYFAMNNTYELIQARSMLLMLMVFLENVHVFNCRSELQSAFLTPLSRNWYIVGGVLLAQGIHILAMNMPFMQALLGVNQVSLETWGQLFTLSLSVLVAMEIFKWWKRKTN